jgi:aminopeptidase N
MENYGLVIERGFATLFSFIAFDVVHPDWDYWADFEKSEKLDSLDFDTNDTHPIHYEVDTNDEIEALLDEIFYIGKKDFRNVLRSHFSKLENINADSQDLCSIFSEVLQVDMKPFFDSWTNKSGYLLITVEGNHIKQVQFKQGFPKDAIWPIPLSIVAYVNGEKVDVKVIFETESLDLKLPE